MKKISLIAAFFVLASGMQAFAQTAAFDFTQIPDGEPQQGWTGNLASLFSVSPDEAITISDLGVFNQSGTGYITGTIQVALFNTTTDQQIGPMVTFGPATQYTAQGYAVYQSITPIILGPGNYAVDAVGFSGTDTNGNNGFGGDPTPGFDNFGGALSFPTPGSAYDYNKSLDLASISDSHIYEAGDFEISHVPEGGASALYVLLAGLCCFAAIFASRKGLVSRA